MKNIINLFIVMIFALILSSSLFAQEKPMKTHSEKSTDEISSSDAKADKHNCTDECAENCCSHHSEVKTANTDESRHVHTEKCKEHGCDHSKVKEARAAFDMNKDGYIYECPMKCEVSDAPGECSKCGMQLKKVSVKEN